MSLSFQSKSSDENTIDMNDGSDEYYAEYASVVSSCRISVIVPLYNAEAYVVDALKSLLAQSVIGMMEIIVVDDHGSDNSRPLVEELCDEHPFGSHIRIVETPCNSGAWAARNLGLSEANGEWIGFMDADDWSEGYMYEALLSVVDLHKADWGYCIAQKEYEKGKAEVLFQPSIRSGEFSDDDRRVMLTKGVAYFWTGIYRREFLLQNGISFPKGKFSEDSYFWYMAVMHAKRIAVTPMVGYHYRIQENSVSKRPDKTKPQQKQSMYDALISRLRADGLYDKYSDELDYLYIKKGLLIPMLIQAINSPVSVVEESKEMIKNMESVLHINYKINSYFKSDLRSVILMFGFAHFPKLLSKILRIKFKRDPF